MSVQGKWALLALLLLAPSVALAPSEATAACEGQRKCELILATTTSVENSGLLEHLLARYPAAAEVEIKVVARGTGQAFRIARNGDADLVLAHHPPSERAFVSQGYGHERVAVMRNHFTLIGPPDDPAAAAQAGDIHAALRRIAAAGEQGETQFLSRGDESGTHRRERELWRAAGHPPDAKTEDWYLETGAGMGTTLNIAAEKQAYTLADRGTWLSFGNARQRPAQAGGASADAPWRGTEAKKSLRALSQPSDALHNPYSLIAVRQTRHPHINEAEALRLIAWLVSPHGQSAIADFRIGGEALFFPVNTPSETARQ